MFPSDVSLAPPTMPSAPPRSSWSGACIAPCVLFPNIGYELLFLKSHHCAEVRSTRIDATLFARPPTARHGRVGRARFFGQELPATRRFQGDQESELKHVCGACLVLLARVGFEPNGRAPRKRRSGKRNESLSTGDSGFESRCLDSFPGRP